MNDCITNLLLEQNKVNDKNLKNLYKKEQYEILLNNVLKILKENEDCSLK